MTQYQLPSLRAIIEAVPTAELLPLDAGHTVQSDEQEMGMTYDELNLFGRLRKVPNAHLESPYVVTICADRSVRSV